MKAFGAHSPALSPNGKRPGGIIAGPLESA
jgi:hypothetical protein